MLFGDRIPTGTLQQVGVSRNLLQEEKAYAELLDLAERIGADIVPGYAVCQFDKARLVPKEDVAKSALQ